MNISFIIRNGKSFIAQLKHGFTYTDFLFLIHQRFGTNTNYRFVLSGKELALQSHSAFTKQKYLIRNGVNIFVLDRIKGGFVEITILKGIIIDDLEEELRTIKTTNDGEYVCEICRDNSNTFRLCCNRVCKSCFGDYFERSSFQLKCMTCRSQLAYSDFFRSDGFIRSLESFDEICKLLKNIDCQICQCGSLLVNETLYSQQKCEVCNRTFCFFCNKDWNEGTGQRRNDLYTCHVNCDYETRITYECVPLQFNKEIKIPNRRFCPKCFTPGAYGSKCKYHTCDICSYSYCFICLNEQNECQQKYSSNYRHQCTEIKKQTYADFPTLIKR